MLLRFTPKNDRLLMVALSPVEGITPKKTLVQLLPGVNEITEEEWVCIRPNICDELERGEIVILAQKVSDGRGRPGGRKAKDLIQMPVNIAVSYINECMNPETLIKWYKEEVREEVRLYITKKLQKLNIDIPEDEIPEAPNASPMSLEEYDEENEEDNLNDNVDLYSLKVEELRKKAKELGIENSDFMKKSELIDILSTME